MPAAVRLPWPRFVTLRMRFAVPRKKSAAPRKRQHARPRKLRKQSVALPKKLPRPLPLRLLRPSQHLLPPSRVQKRRVFSLLHPRHAVPMPRRHQSSHVRRPMHQAWLLVVAVVTRRMIAVRLAAERQCAAAWFDPSRQSLSLPVRRVRKIAGAAS